MKRLLALGALVAAVAAAAIAGRADAILFGSPDTEHRGVGYVVFYDDELVPLWRCTGTLVTNRVVLTAGHCAGTFDYGDGPHTPVLAQAWFDDQIEAGDEYPGGGASCKGYHGWPCTGGDSFGIPVAHPDFQGSAAEGVVFDVGVVLLAHPQRGRDVIDLASEGTLDEAEPGSPMTLVGYGTQSVTPPPEDQRQRTSGEITFLRTEDGSQEFDDPTYADFKNAAPGAVACVGDSGGPILDSDGEIVAVSSLVDPFLDGYCQGIGYHFRTDIEETLSFLARYGVRVKDRPGRGKGRDHRGHGHGHGRDNGHHGWKGHRGFHCPPANLTDRHFGRGR